MRIPLPREETTIHLNHLLWEARPVSLFPEGIRSAELRQLEDRTSLDGYAPDYAELDVVPRYSRDPIQVTFQIDPSQAIPILETVTDDEVVAFAGYVNVSLMGDFRDLTNRRNLYPLELPINVRRPYREMMGVLNVSLSMISRHANQRRLWNHVDYPVVYIRLLRVTVPIPRNFWFSYLLETNQPASSPTPPSS